MLETDGKFGSSVALLLIGPPAILAGLVKPRFTAWKSLQCRYYRIQCDRKGRVDEETRLPALFVPEEPEGCIQCYSQQLIL